MTSKSVIMRITCFSYKNILGEKMFKVAKLSKDEQAKCP